MSLKKITRAFTENVIGHLSEIMSLNSRNIYNKQYGILQYKSYTETGEEFLIKKILPSLIRMDKAVVFDVGANKGDYTDILSSAHPGCTIHCFEPHPQTASALDDRFKDRRQSVHVNAAGLGASIGEAELFDYPCSNGSSHATLYQDVMLKQHKAKGTTVERVPIGTLDNYCKENGINRIDLLKVDTEGHELSVLDGGKELISEKSVSIVQFEFNEMNVISRSLMIDFYSRLQDFNFYRLRHDGLLKMGDYSARHEIFEFQNILAVRSDLDARKFVVRHV